MERNRRIGFVGLGKMGSPICRRLLEAGHLVTVLPSPRAEGRLPSELAQTGCAVARTAAELASSTDILITCLPSSLEVETILSGETGFFSDLGDRSGVLHIDHTSGNPGITRQLAKAWKERRGNLVDAAISGTPEAALNGKLRLLCGGDAGLLARVEEVAKAYASEFIHAGETGNGHMLRLVGGLMGYGMAVLSSEAFQLCAATGIAPEKLRAMITGSGADSGTFQAMATTELEGPNSAARRRLSLGTVFKDLDTLRTQAEELGSEIPVASLVASRIHQAMAHGGENAVISDLTQYLNAIPAGGPRRGKNDSSS